MTEKNAIEKIENALTETQTLLNSYHKKSPAADADEKMKQLIEKTLKILALCPNDANAESLRERLKEVLAERKWTDIS